MYPWIKKLRAGWTPADTTILATNTTAFLLFWGNCWWESVTLCYLASAAPLAIQAIHQRSGPSTLRRALIFGITVGLLWPLGEWFVVNNIGWWGQYTAPGPAILETPIYCILIGALASTHCCYICLRALQYNLNTPTAAAITALSALLIGAIGENFFVAAKMWTYRTSTYDWAQIPAFVPISYALAYATIPLLKKYPPPTAALLFSAITLLISTTLGIATGFFPE